RPGARGDVAGAAVPWPPRPLPAVGPRRRGGDHAGAHAGPAGGGGGPPRAPPPTHRARILSLFQLGLMGGAPVGALLIGYLAAVTGPRAAPVYPAACMLLILAGLFARSQLWRQGAAV